MRSAQHDRMTTMSILVTGGAGLIGSVTAEHLRTQGHQVRAVDLHPSRQGPAVEIADLLLRESAYRITEGVDAVVHLANWPDVHRTGATQVFVENTTMTQHLFQAMAERGIKRLVYVSSIQAFSGHRSVEDGAPSGLPYLPLDGDIPANPSNTYGASKAAGEMQCRWLASAHGVAAVALRLPATLRHSFPAIRRRWGDGRLKSKLDEGFLVIHVNDAARLIGCLLERHQAGYRCVQGGSRQHMLQQSAAELIATYYPEVPLRRALASLSSLCDLEVLERDFGFVPVEDLWQERPPGAVK